MLRWTDGHAVFNVPVQVGTRLGDLEICFHQSGTRNQHFEVVVNGVLVTQGLLRSGTETLRLDLGALQHRIGIQSELVLEILSSTFIDTAASVRRGVPLSSIVLERKVDSSTDAWVRPEVVSGREALPGPWYMDDAKVFGDVLQSTDSLERLYITGGEPLINERVSAVLQHLVDTGAAERIHLEISTNCTSSNLDQINRLKKFRRVELLLSLDAVGESYNYIRYPARWESIDKNVRRLKLEHQLVCKVPPVVQAYNILGLVDLYRYCDAMNLEVTLNVLHLPDRLAIHHLSPSVRKAAAAKLFEYHDTDCLPFSKPQVLALARYLDELSTPMNGEVLREFMLFTNDLDATRGQSFRVTHAEFVELLAQDGFEWTDETRFVGNAAPNRSARERDYAWL